MRDCRRTHRASSKYEFFIYKMLIITTPGHLFSPFSVHISTASLSGASSLTWERKGGSLQLNLSAQMKIVPNSRLRDARTTRAPCSPGKGFATRLWLLKLKWRKGGNTHPHYSSHMAGATSLRCLVAAMLKGTDVAGLCSHGNFYWKAWFLVPCNKDLPSSTFGNKKVHR